MKQLLLLLIFVGLSAKAQQFSIADLPSYEVCDDNNDSVGQFDLDSYFGPILLSSAPGNPQEYGYRFFLTQTDAMQNMEVNAIPNGNPYFNIDPYSQILYVRVYEIANPDHFGITTATLIVNQSPVVFPIDVLFVPVTTPASSVDLDTHVLPFFGGVPGIATNFYVTLADAQAAQNPISQSCCYVPMSGETLYASFTNASGCFTIAAFEISMVVDLPDTALRQRILSSVASGSVLIAGHYQDDLIVPINVDANNDGQIQVSEALQVNYLNMTGDAWWSTPGDISVLDGLEVFSNLKFLDISGNAIATFDFTSLDQLEILRAHGNLLTDIDFSNFPELTSVDVSANNFTSLDFGANTELYDLGCGNNPNLASVNVKNVTQQNCAVGVMSFDAWMETPNLVSVCADANEIECLQQVLTWNGAHPNTVFTSDCSLAVPDVSKADAILFPNPTSSTVEIKSDFDIKVVTVFDSNGRKVEAKRQSNVLDLTGLSSGIYLVKIETTNAISVQKVSKI
ncbi:T9SS type A sorting domain-containing protein [Flavobacterium sp.]|uniref:T9SS type A sorting domain-containing protein n=1 Tax=Flavobacterium sp. TaxID=239 RepID=UPI0025BB7E5F|nr:T9SS type A sorting domain-containing protein [Flavobacterium sp.]